jgi:anti-sigma factor RsiW
MSESEPTTPDPLDDDLVAYLDGELDEKSAQQVEARIGTDPAARAEADALRKTWDLLDYLPRPEPSPTFTTRTLDRLAVRPSGSLPAPAPVRRRWAVRLAWAAAALVALAAGYGAAGLAPRPAPPGPAEIDEVALARDRRVIENLQLYQHVDNLEFLLELAKPDLFGDDAPGH